MNEQGTVVWIIQTRKWKVVFPEGLPQWIDSEHVIQTKPPDWEQVDTVIDEEDDDYEPHTA